MIENAKVLASATVSIRELIVTDIPRRSTRLEAGPGNSRGS